jgi:hypothetical protein
MKLLLKSLIILSNNGCQTFIYYKTNIWTFHFFEGLTNDGSSSIPTFPWYNLIYLPKSLSQKCISWPQFYKRIYVLAIAVLLICFMVYEAMFFNAQFLQRTMIRINDSIFKIYLKLLWSLDIRMIIIWC